MVNQVGFRLTVVPFGGRTAPTYVSVLFLTFMTVLRTETDPFNADIVTEGRFRLYG